MKITELVDEMTYVPKAHAENLSKLAQVLSKLEHAYGQKLQVTSGYRTWVDQKRIYQHINDQRLIAGKAELPVPIHSMHMLGCAADLLDPRQELQKWIEKHKNVCEELALYFEGDEKSDGAIDWSWTPSWVHAQTRPPQSLKRFYRPFS